MTESVLHPARKTRLITGIALAAFLFAFGLLAIPARLFVGDPYAWRGEAISLLLHQHLQVPPSVALHHGEINQYFTRNPVTGEWYSKYGVMSGLLNTLPLGAELFATGQLPPWDSEVRRFYLGIFYAGLGALFGLALYFLCGHYGVSDRAALAYVGLTIFCTYLGYYLRATNSEAYQLLFFTAFFERVAAYRASGSRKACCLYAAWIYLFFLVHVKVSHFMVAGIFALGVGAWEYQNGLRGRRLADFLAVRLAAPFLLIMATVAWINTIKFGSAWGTGYTMWQADTFEHTVPPWSMVWNVFFREQWCVPIHYPLFILALFGAREFWRRFPLDAWLAGMVFTAVFLVIGSMPVWRGEWCYGPRYFLFSLPALCLPALLVLERFFSAEERRRRAVKTLLAGTLLAALVSAFFQFQVARLDPFFAYWIRPDQANHGDEVLADYWEKRNFAWIAAIAWRYRDHPEDLWWMRRLKGELSPQGYDKELAHLKRWLERTNFYWWSPRD